jgi:hypothetical protein
MSCPQKHFNAKAHLQQRLNARVNKVEVGAKGVLRIFEK